jgi:hypothetical protein
LKQSGSVAFGIGIQPIKFDFFIYLFYYILMFHETASDEAAHQSYPASAQEVAILADQAEALVNSHGEHGEQIPGLLIFRIPEIPSDLIPMEANQYLQFDRSEVPVDCIIVTDTSTGKNLILLSQIAVPEAHSGTFMDSVSYSLSGYGSRTAQATFSDPNLLLPAPNPDHISGGYTPYIEQTEIQQLAEIMKVALALGLRA